jgi:hypothetical protein
MARLLSESGSSSVALLSGRPKLLAASPFENALCLRALAGGHLVSNLDPHDNESGVNGVPDEVGRLDLVSLAIAW